MKRTLLEKIPDGLPEGIAELIGGSPIYDSSCSREARVYFIDKQDGFYLKCSPKGTLSLEAKMNDYFHKKGFGAEVIDYISTDYDYMLTRRVIGEDCTHRDYLSEPERLCDLLGERLRALHEVDAKDCPVQDRMGEYLALADKNYAEGKFDPSLFEGKKVYTSAEDAYRVLSEGRSLLRNEVLLHGDFCLPNIMLENFKVTSFIDVGNGGAGDRHVDLFWGAWTLVFNLKTDAYCDRFLDAYGRDKISMERLSVIAAAEVFG